MKQEPVPLDGALRLGRQVAEELETGYGKRVVHRDLKPENIKITPQAM